MSALLALFGLLGGIFVLGGGSSSSDTESTSTAGATTEPDHVPMAPTATDGDGDMGAGALTDTPPVSLVIDEPDSLPAAAPTGGTVEIPLVSDSAYDIGWAGLSAEEQLIVELVNRARLDPAAEDARQVDGFASGVTTAPKEALAVNEDLSDAAEGHSEDMIARDFFSHVNPDGQNPSSRAMEEGYPRGAGENIGFIGSSGSFGDLQARAEAHHNNLWTSDDHQENFMSTSYSEIGVGYVYGEFEYDGVTYANSTLLTQKLSDQGETYLTGVVIDDQDGDEFYDLGEGQGDVRVTAYNDTGVYTTSTYASGGYSLELDSGSYTVVFHGGDLEGVFETSVTIGSQNVKLDVIEDQDAEDFDLLFA